MTQLPSGLSTRPESFAPSGESSLRLQQAIESLNLNLDDELYRYRQSRSGQNPLPVTPARLQLRTARKPIDLISVKPAASAAAPTATAAPPPPPARLQDLTGQAALPNHQTYPPAAINQVRLSHGGTLTTYRSAPEDYLESTEALLGSLPKGAKVPADPAYAPTLVERLSTPLGVGALLLLLVGSASFGYLVTSPQSVRHLTDNPIVRRLKGDPLPAEGDSEGAIALEDGGAQASSGFRPQGPDLSEKEFMSLDLNNISTLPSTNAARAGQGRVVPAQVPAGDGQSPALTGDRPDDATPPPSRPGVPTAAGNSSSAVLRAEIVAAPNPAVRPAPTPSSATRPTPNPSSAIPTPAPAATRAPAPTPASPMAAPPALQMAPPAANAQPPQPLALDRAPAPPRPIAPPAAVAPPAPITQAPPQAAPSYYVVTDYNGAQSLESARSAVGDAYVRNFSSGTRIQMGAFSQQSAAQNLVNQLQGQGIPAQVISP